MGTILVIKNADFSNVAVDKIAQWYINDYSNAVAAGMNFGLVGDMKSGYYVTDSYQDVQNKEISCMRFRPGAVGTITIGYSDGLLNNSTVTEKAVITISQGEVGTTVVKNFTPFTVPANCYICFGKASFDTGSVYMGYKADMPKMYNHIGANDEKTPEHYSICLGIDWGCV